MAITDIDQDSIDARRRRTLKQRHAYALIRLATGNSSYNSDKAPAILDAWADKAAAEVEAFNPEMWHEEAGERIKELESQGFNHN